MTTKKPVTILVVDDDPDDRLLIADALKTCRISNPTQFLESAEQLIHHLKNGPKPGFIFLDIQMPKMNGLEALQIVRENSKSHDIPIIMLTTSRAEEDVLQAYGLGANSFITKPVTFDGLVQIMQKTTNYWLEIVHLPTQEA